LALTAGCQFRQPPGETAHRLRDELGEPTPRAADCYRFVLTRPEVDVCMTGPRSASEMDDALDALRLGPMGEDELAWMQRVGAAVRGR
jgi:predicted aldo/keto reductase-like oxidoreductase